jgi:hypothetical protein
MPIGLGVMRGFVKHWIYCVCIHKVFNSNYFAFFWCGIFKIAVIHNYVVIAHLVAFHYFIIRHLFVSLLIYALKPDARMVAASSISKSSELVCTAEYNFTWMLTKPIEPFQVDLIAKCLLHYNYETGKRFSLLITPQT